MKREELVVLREEAMNLDGMEPHRVGEMWRDRDKREKMLASTWLILHYESLHDGHWPEVMPEEIPSHGGAYHHGPQEIPAIFAAEISSRIKECGRDGQLLWDYYGDRDEPWNPAPEQFRRINRALEYCSGWRRKRRMYKDWYQRHYKAKAVAKTS